MLSVITALEFFQHYFSEMGHRDLLVTQNLSQAIEQQTLHYLTRSVRRRAATLYAGHVQQLGGANPLPNLMEVKG
jgi:hypothetical protein